MIGRNEQYLSGVDGGQTNQTSPDLLREARHGQGYNPTVFGTFAGLTENGMAATAGVGALNKQFRTLKDS
jgi:hypothetical protein